MIASLKAEARSTKSEKEIRNQSSGIRKPKKKFENRIPNYEIRKNDETPPYQPPASPASGGIAVTNINGNCSQW